MITHICVYITIYIQDIGIHVHVDREYRRVCACVSACMVACVYIYYACNKIASVSESKVEKRGETTQLKSYLLQYLLLGQPQPCQAGFYRRRAS